MDSISLSIPKIDLLECLKLRAGNGFYGYCEAEYIPWWHEVFDYDDNRDNDINDYHDQDDNSYDSSQDGNPDYSGNMGDNFGGYFLPGQVQVGLAALHNWINNNNPTPEHYTKYCAKAVKQALVAMTGLPYPYGSNANDMPGVLPSFGYREAYTITAQNLEHYADAIQPGTILVFDPVDNTENGGRNHPYGHIEIWDGQHWLSDCTQNDAYSSDRDYLEQNGIVRIFEPQYYLQS